MLERSIVEVELNEIDSSKNSFTKSRSKEDWKNFCDYLTEEASEGITTALEFEELELYQNLLLRALQDDAGTEIIQALLDLRIKPTQRHFMNEFAVGRNNYLPLLSNVFFELSAEKYNDIFFSLKNNQWTEVFETISLLELEDDFTLLYFLLASACANKYFPAVAFLINTFNLNCYSSYINEAQINWKQCFQDLFLTACSHEDWVFIAENLSSYVEVNDKVYLQKLLSYALTNYGDAKIVKLLLQYDLVLNDNDLKFLAHFPDDLIVYVIATYPNVDAGLCCIHIANIENWYLVQALMQEVELTLQQYIEIIKIAIAHNPSQLIKLCKYPADLKNLANYDFAKIILNAAQEKHWQLFENYIMHNNYIQLCQFDTDYLLIYLGMFIEAALRESDFEKLVEIIALGGDICELPVVKANITDETKIEVFRSHLLMTLCKANTNEEWIFAYRILSVLKGKIKLDYSFLEHLFFKALQQNADNTVLLQLITLGTVITTRHVIEAVRLNNTQWLEHISRENQAELLYNAAHSNEESKPHGLQVIREINKRYTISNSLLQDLFIIFAKKRYWRSLLELISYDVQLLGMNVDLTDTTSDIDKQGIEVGFPCKIYDGLWREAVVSNREGSKIFLCYSDAGGNNIIDIKTQSNRIKNIVDSEPETIRSILVSIFYDALKFNANIPEFYLLLLSVISLPANCVYLARNSQILFDTVMSDAVMQYKFFLETDNDTDWSLRLHWIDNIKAHSFDNKLFGLILDKMLSEKKYKEIQFSLLNKLADLPEAINQKPLVCQLINFCYGITFDENQSSFWSPKQGYTNETKFVAACKTINFLMFGLSQPTHLESASLSNQFANFARNGLRPKGG